MAFHYINDLEKLFQKCYNDVTFKGRLTFSIEHPGFNANTNGYRKDSEGTYWCLKDHHEEGKRKFDCFINDVTKHHRTLKTNIKTLIFSRFRINVIDDEHIHWVEFIPSRKNYKLFLGTTFNPPYR